MLNNMLNVSTSAWRPGPGGPAATCITVAWPGHDWDSVQAPIWLVACRVAAGVVICSRLLVRKTRPRARGPRAGPVWLLATPAMHTQRVMDAIWSIQVQLAEYRSSQPERQGLWRGHDTPLATWPAAQPEAFTQLDLECETGRWSRIKQGS